MQKKRRTLKLFKKNISLEGEVQFKNNSMMFGNFPFTFMKENKNEES